MIQRNVAVMKAPRTRFNFKDKKLTTANVGELVPFYAREVLPGDSFKVDTNFVARLSSSFIRPPMMDLFVDCYYFFVPSRLVYERWEEIFGENKKGAWAQPEPVSSPTIPVNITVPSGTVYDCLEVPVGPNPKGLNCLLPRMFAMIYNEWFRDENLIDPMFIPKGEWQAYELPNNNPWSPNNYTGKLPKVAKFHDIFTSSLPNTQKSLNPVNVPLAGFVPVTAGTSLNDLGNEIRLATNQYGNSMALVAEGEASPSGNKTVKGMQDALGGPTYTINGTNLGVDLGSAGLLTIPDLRYAFSLQRILEREAVSGSRYTEYLLSAFGVQSPDARLQRPEYLGGKREPLSVQQVAQTTRGSEVGDELGSLGAFSLSNGNNGFTKAFVEHGFCIGVFCIRQMHYYQNSIPKHFQRSDRFSYFDPMLDHISEQPVYRSEIYSASESDIRGNIFGFQEAWYDLRNGRSSITRQMRSDATDDQGNPLSLDIWHFGDTYDSSPYLNQGFIEETPMFVDRTIAVPSTSMDQFIFDFTLRHSVVRRMAPHSTPGLNYI